MNRQNYFFMRIGILISVVFTLFVVAVPTIVFGNTYYVASDGGNTSPYDTWAKSATSIQTAIDAASNGDIIMVGSSDGHGEGTYTENVVVNKQLTIQSENGYTTTTVVAASSGTHVFEVTVDNVTINGFSIYGATGSGIYLNTVHGCTIENNLCGWDGSHTNYSEGILLESSSGNSLTSNVVNNNSADGISLSSSSSNTLNSNTTNNNGGDGFHLVSSSNSNILNNNTASGNGNNGILMVASTDNNLTGNTANNNLATHGFYLTSSSNNNTLNNNTADSNSGNGICLESVSGNNLTSNTVTHNDFGIYLTVSSNNTITSNIMNNNDGIVDGDGIMLNINCSYNIIANNTANNNPGDGIELYNSSNNTIKGNTLDTSFLPDPGASMRINYYSSNNTIVNNTVINGSVGIVLEQESNYNTVASNTVTGHSQRGLEFYENASYNIITRNNISNNDIYGIWLKSGSYNTFYLNDVSSNTTSNIYSESSTTTWHSPTTIYYDYNIGTFHKGYLGNYYSDGTHTGSNGIGGTYTIATDNDDDYQLIQTSDYYSLQAWWLYSDDKMYRDDFTKAGGSVTISGSSSNIWIADQAALTDINFSGSDTWTGQLVFTSAPTGGVSPHTFTVEIGSSTNGSDFTAGGPDATITGDGSATVFTFTTDASAFSVTTGKYLALKITSNDAEYSVRTGGAWSYTSSPESSTDYTLQVTLSTFTAQFIENTPTLYWTTQSETDNIGWNIYRNDEQEFSSSTILTDEMIPGNGTTTEPSYYNYSDNENLTIGETYYYWLESIDYGGISQVYSRIAQITIPDPTVNPPDLEPPIVYNFKNVPNPVSTSSKFQFTLDKASFVSVSIYNIKGKLVKTLPLVVTTEDVEATVYWNGKDENGNIVKNGIYLYQLNVNGKTYKTNKLILMR